MMKPPIEAWTDEQIMAEIRPALEAIKPILAAKAPEMQSAILAELLALWVGAIVVSGDWQATMAVREAALSSHMKLVQQLIAVGMMDEELK